MPLGIIPFMLLFIPILEIAVFILVGGQVGVITTLALILFTAILGSILLRVQGLTTLNAIQAKTAAGELPGEDLVNGVMIMVAGVLLLTPGFVTDSIGFLLFFPPFRKVLWSGLASKIIVQTNASFTDGFARRANTDDIVDLDPSEYAEKANPDSPWHNDNKPLK